MFSATAYDLFRFEDVTKGHRDIHAHGYDKMAEYLMRLGLPSTARIGT